MINAVHTLVYADDADAARAFFRDILGWPYLDVHDGWLIFKTGPSELDVHPTSATDEGDRSTTARHEITLMCEDIEGTVADLKAKGAEFSGESGSAGFGRTISMKVPGASEIMLYEPRHPLAYVLNS